LARWHPSACPLGRDRLSSRGRPGTNAPASAALQEGRSHMFVPGKQRRVPAVALAVFASLFLLALVATESAQAAFPGRNGDIYFHTDTASGSAIAWVTPQG